MLRFLLILVGLHALPALAEPDLRTVETRSYTIHSDLPKADFERIAEHMDLVHAQFSERFRGFAVYDTAKLPVWVFNHREDYVAYLARFGVNAVGTGGLFFVSPETGPGLAAWQGDSPLESLQGVLRHEGFHQFGYQRFANNMPQWLNEGLAEYFNDTIITPRRSATGLVDPLTLARLRLAQKKGDLLHLQELMGISSQDWITLVNDQDAKAGVMYPQAWSVVHFLIKGENGRYEKLMLEYLLQLSRGQTPRIATVETFGVDLEPMHRAWLEHLEGLEPDPILLAQHRLRAAALAVASAHASDPGATIDLATAAKAPHASRAQPALRVFVGDQPDWWLNGPAAGSPIRLRPSRDTPPTLEIREGRFTLSVQWTKSQDDERFIPSIIAR